MLPLISAKPQNLSPPLSFHFPLFPSSPTSSLSFHPPLKNTLRLRIRSVDAAQPYDYESHLRTQHFKSQSLKIAILGFGNFGQFLAKTFSRQGHTLLAYSRTNYTDTAKSLGVTFYNNPDDLFESHPEVVILCTSILSTEKVLQTLPFQRLKRSTLFVDVLSFDILCTHPMFGPESGKNSWAGLPFVYDKLGLRFLDVFAKEGCRMVEMTCAEHDRHAAGSQFVTHTMGRVLERFGLESSPINTKGYDTLLDLVEVTAGDSFELYYGLFMYNKNAMEQLERLDMAFEAIKKELFGKLHHVYRKQLFGNADEGVEDRPKVQKLLHNGAPPSADAVKPETS
ncbi:arogenate dehydrogenase [Salix suchowensis]|nr:arogenate dehydrogenase [Salix suchowensis]